MNLPVELIQRAEQLGYDSTAEAYGSDAMTPLAYLAAKTERIKLCTGIIQLSARATYNAAMQAATIDAMAGGECGHRDWRVRAADRRGLVLPTVGRPLLHRWITCRS